MWALTRILVMLNLAVFAAVGVDKFMAARRGRRIPESSLLVFSSFGMAPGLWLGMFFFRHKTAKPSFLAGAFVALGVSVGLYVLLWRVNA
jgi:uncharacterized membrane protein YsdA (DUF1294 family)